MQVPLSPSDSRARFPGVAHGWGARAAAVLAVVATTLVIILAMQGPSSSLPNEHVETAGSMEPFAIVGRTVDIVWSEDGANLAVGAAVGKRRIVFSSGLLQLDFLAGARLIVEGPADLELHSPTSTQVSRGSVRCDVSELGHGFELFAGGYSVVDLGTSFGLEVPVGRDPEVHVFDGAVSISTGRDDSRVEIAHSSAVRLSAGGIEQASFTSGKFPSPDDLDARADEHMTRSLARWRTAQERLRRDPDLIANYTFSEEGDSDRSARNHAGHGGCTDGFIVGGKRTAGRWPDTKALSFRGGTERMLLVGPGELPAITLATWLKLESFPDNLAAIVISEDKRRWLATSAAAVAPVPDNAKVVRQLRWEINSTGSCFLNIGTGPLTRAVRWDICEARHALAPSALGRWSFFAATHDGTSRITRLFVDGRMVAEATTSAEGPLLVGCLDVGNFSAHPHETDSGVSYGLRGAVDEVFMIRRALTPAEIANLHAAGRSD